MDEEYVDYEELGERLADEYRQSVDMDKELGKVIYNIGSLIPGYRSLYGLLNKKGYGLREAALDLQDDIVPGAIQYRDWYENGITPDAQDVGLAMFAAVPYPGAKRAAAFANAKKAGRIAKGKIATPHAPNKFDATNFTQNPMFQDVQNAIAKRLEDFRVYDYKGVPLDYIGAEDAMDAAILRHDASNYIDVVRGLRDDFYHLFPENKGGFRYKATSDLNPKKLWMLVDDEGKWHDIIDEDFRAKIFEILNNASPGYKKAAARQGVRDMISTPAATSTHKAEVPKTGKVLKGTFDPSKIKK